MTVRPVYAGIARSVIGRNMMIFSPPRVCGDYSKRLSLTRSATESAPRMRGLLWICHIDVHKSICLPSIAGITRAVHRVSRPDRSSPRKAGITPFALGCHHVLLSPSSMCWDYSLPTEQSGESLSSSPPPSMRGIALDLLKFDSFQ